jgi:hypothetical protein
VATLPIRVARLLERAPLVVDCEDAAVWSAQGRLALESTRPLEVLCYLAAAPLLVQEPLDQWPGVSVDTVLQEVWAPGARNPDNRESGEAWLSKSLWRLQEDIGRAAGRGDLGELVRRNGALRLHGEVIVSDVEAFMAALERARSARGPSQPIVAEEAVALRVADLLPRAQLRRRGVANTHIELYRWLTESHWERAARRLEALGRDAGAVLARAYRDAGRHADARAVYGHLLSEDPLDRRAQEGLLAAAAGTGDVAQLHDAWQQLCACLDGEDDAELLAQYERLVRELGAGAAGRSVSSSRSEVGARG